MTRPSNPITLATPAAALPAASAHEYPQAVQDYLAREKELFKRTLLATEIPALVTSATDSPRALALAQYVDRMSHEAGAGYETEGRRRPVFYLGGDTVDRTLNQFGRKKEIKTELVKAFSSVLQKEIIVTELNRKAKTLENANEDDLRQASALAKSETDSKLIYYGKLKLAEEAYTEAHGSEALAAKLLLLGQQFANNAPDEVQNEIFKSAYEDTYGLTAAMPSQEAINAQIELLLVGNFAAHPELQQAFNRHLQKTAADSLLTEVSAEGDAPANVKFRLKLAASEAKLKQIGDKYLGDLLFSEQFPRLHALINDQSDEEELAASFPAEMVARAGKYYSSLKVDSPETTRAILEARMGRWMAETLSITLLYLQATLPTAIDLARTKKLLADHYKKIRDGSAIPGHQILPKLVAGFLVPLSNLMLETIPNPGPDNPTYSYFSALITRLMNIGLEKIVVTQEYKDRDFGLIEYMIFLLANLNNETSLSETDRDNIQKLKKAFSFIEVDRDRVTGQERVEGSLTSIAQKVCEILNLDSELSKYLNFSARLLTDPEYYFFVEKIKLGSKEDISLLMERFNRIPTTATYVKTVAALILSCAGVKSAEAVSHSQTIWNAIPENLRPQVCSVAMHMAHECSKDGVLGITKEDKVAFKLAMNTLLKYNLRDYFAEKSIEVDFDQSSLTQFLALVSDKKAERNIASAYQIFALLQELESYNDRKNPDGNEKHSEADKAQALRAVMNVVQNIQAEAAIRGHRSVKGQSSRFAELLELDIPVERMQGSIQFPVGFDLTSFQEIKRLHDLENTWFNKATKKFNNWAKQNPWAIFAAVVSTLLIAAGTVALALALFSPAAIVVVPLLGVSLGLANLLLPAAITLGVGVLLAAFTAGVNEIRHTVAAKLVRQGLDKQQFEHLSSSLPDLPLPINRERSVSGLPVGGQPHSPPAHAGASGAASGVGVSEGGGRPASPVSPVGTGNARNEAAAPGAHPVELTSGLQAPRG